MQSRKVLDTEENYKSSDQRRARRENEPDQAENDKDDDEQEKRSGLERLLLFI